uniref:Uncharacterized protein n=1 Tax=Knipowitschia caucasica TaxID=637954 RepID=A0AAV2MNH8_KNICA
MTSARTYRAESAVWRSFRVCVLRERNSPGATSADDVVWICRRGAALRGPQLTAPPTPPHAPGLSHCVRPLEVSDTGQEAADLTDNARADPRPSSPPRYQRAGLARSQPHLGRGKGPRHAQEVVSSDVQPRPPPWQQQDQVCDDRGAGCRTRRP